MNKQHKRFITLFALFIILSTTAPYFFTISNLINEGESVVTDRDENSEDLTTEIPQTSALNSLTTPGAKLGVQGYTSGVKEGIMQLTDWVYSGSGTYWTQPTAYVVPFAKSKGASLNPTWQYQSMTTSVWGLTEQNNFLWDKPLNSASWSALGSISGSYGTAAYAGQMLQGTAGRDFNGYPVGYVDFDNYQRSYNIDPLTLAGWWQAPIATTDSLTRSESSKTQYEGGGPYTCPTTYIINTACQGTHPDSSDSGTPIATTGYTDAGLESDVTLKTGYFVQMNNGDNDCVDDWTNTELYFDDTYYYTIFAKDYVPYVWDGTTPYDVDFTGNVQSLSVIANNLARRTDAAMTYTQSVTFTITLYSPDESRNQPLYSGTFSKTAIDTNFARNDIQAFFTEGGNYILRVEIAVTLRIYCPTFTHNTGSSGDVRIDYNWLQNSGAAEVTYNVRADTFRFAISEEKPYPTPTSPTDPSASQYAYLQSNINFGDRYVQSGFTPTLEFDYSTQGDITPHDNTQSMGKIRATAYYRHDSGPDTSDFKEWNISPGGSGHAIMQLTVNIGSTQYLNISDNIDVRIGVYIYERSGLNPGFEITWGTGGSGSPPSDWSIVMFANPSFTVKTIPKPQDVSLRVNWQDSGVYQNGKTFSTGSYGSGSVTHTRSESDLGSYSALTFYYSSTSQKLQFNYEQRMVFTFNDFSLTSIIRVTNGSSTVHYDLKFDWNVPNNKSLLKSGYDYSNSFKYNITCPRWLQNGEPYWNLDLAHLTTGANQEWISATESGGAWNKETQIYVNENTTYAGYSDTQICQADNILFDEYLAANLFRQYWECNFSAPNIITRLLIDDNSDFSSPTSTLLIGNNSNIRLDYGGSLSTGTAGVKWLTAAESQKKAKELAASGGSTSFTGSTNGWDTTGQSLGSYYTVGNYTQLRTGNMPAEMTGINRFGYCYRPFDLVMYSYIQNLWVTPKIYDTMTNGASNQLINISILWKDQYGIGITAGNVRISIAEWVVNASGENKYPVIPAEFLQLPMLDRGNGLYSLYLNPNFYGHLGNITWGYHNFTISLSKTGVLGRAISNNFNIKIDTVMTVYDPDQDSKEPKTQHPHFRYAIMGGNDTGTPKDFMTVFGLYYYENSSTPSYFSDSAGSPYRKMIEIKYSCINFTNGDLWWWNWSWNQKEFSDSNTGNPINGTFISSGNTWSATIYFPTEKGVDFKNIPQYHSGIFLEYNITARIIYNNTYPAPRSQPWLFQPNIVENQTCENGFIHTNPLLEESILLCLINPEQGNFTRLVMINNPIVDGRPYQMGLFNNDSSGTAPFYRPYEMQYYKIEQYYYNTTIGPHGRKDNEFRLRVIFNGTYTYIAKDTHHYYPPCGPLNATGTTIKMKGWNSSDIYFTANSAYVWHCNVVQNTSGLVKTMYGVTYESPWLNFDDKPSGNYSLSIMAIKPGYKDASMILQLEILEQRTELLEKNSTFVSRSGMPSSPIIKKVPYGNHLNFSLTYSDITNGNKVPIKKASISCVSDNLESYGSPFKNNQSIYGQSTWRWRNENNGNYTIFVDYTFFESKIDKILAEMALLNLRIYSQNYSARTFQLVLNITKRQVQIICLAQNNVSIYTESAYFKILKLVTFVYEIRDLDNYSKNVDFDIDLFSSKCSSFSFYYWNNTKPLTSLDYAVLSEYWDSGHLKYNITFDLKYVNIGTYNIMFRIESTILKLAVLNNTFRIDPAPIQLVILNSRNLVEYLPASIIPKLNTLSYQPYYELKVIDIVHTLKFGSDYIVVISGISVTIVAPVYNNPNFANFNSLTAPGITSSNDLAVYAETSGPGTIKIFIDAQQMSAEGTVYNVNLTISKNNYQTEDIFVSFTIINATTHFENDNVLLAYQEGAITNKNNFPSSTSVYRVGDHIIIPWSKYLGIKFTYITTNLGTKISNDIVDVYSTGGMHYATHDFYSSQLWPEFSSLRVFTDLGSGVHYLEFPVNISSVGIVDVWFNFTIWAANFDPCTFLINITIRDRETSFEEISKPNVGYWTGKISYTVVYYDNDYYQVGGLKEPIKSATLNGTVNGILDFGNGETANWSVQEFEKDIQKNLPYRYLIEILTERLIVSNNYTVNFLLGKLHYQTQSTMLSFILNPIPISLNVTIRPDNGDESDEFKPDEHKIIYIYVSVFVLFQNATGRAELNVDIVIPSIIVRFELIKGEDIVYEGELEWDDTEGQFVASFPTKDEKGTSLTGVYELFIIVETGTPNIQGTEEKIKLLGIGVGEERIPDWFWWILAIVIGVAVAMSGYAVKKAIYLRIPFVLRKIDETVKKIEKDKFPPVGVMTGRNEFIINSVINYLEECGLEWERKDKFEVKKVGEAAPKEKLAPYKLEEIQAELNKISGLSAEEKTLFVDELKRLDREAQDEFLGSLKGQTQKKE